ncbi:MAG TPA: SCO6880 family protein, partial [Streptosporangiaceae bacterium]|nr:SCO6880 family protein [Streptosporangiaceae bacterium]
MGDTTTARPTYGNWRLPSRPGIGPLGLLGTVLMLGGLILTLLTALISWIAALGTGVVITAATVPLAIRTADGRSGFAVLAARTGWVCRRVAGEHTYLSGPLSRVPGGTFTPPGLLAALEMLEGRDVYHRPFGVLHDKTAGTCTIVLECDPDGGALVDAGQVDTWVACWGGWLAGLAHEPGLAGATVIIETAPDPGTRLAAEVLPRLDPAAPGQAREIMTEVVASYPATSSQTGTYVTLTYRPAGRADRDDMVTNLAIRIAPLAAGLIAAGGGAVQPM